MNDRTQTISPRRIAGTDADVLTSFYPIPGLGLVPINSFVLHAAQPVVIDTGAFVLRDAYLAALRSAIDLDEVRWIYLTHVDLDHIGCVREVLDAAPRARLVTTFLGYGKLGLIHSLAPERVYMLNPGQRLDVGDRDLVALRPPTFDAPETTALFDTKTRALFSSDCFGAVLIEPADEAASIPPTALHDGIVLWTTVDAPWLANVEPAAFELSLARVRELGPSIVLGSHLPPARGMLETLLANVAAARSAAPFVGPDQRAFTAMLASMSAEGAVPLVH